MTDEPVPKRRRWWFLGGLALLALVILVVAAVIAGVSYGNYLIRTYTSADPKPVPELVASPEALEQLKARWTAFQDAVNSGKPTAPLQLSAQDLNVFLSSLPDAGHRLHLSITDDRLRGQFCIPLDRSGQAKLRGRYLNGVATFHLAFDDGFLTLTVATLEANEQPIPHWLLSRLQKRNLLASLDDNLNLTLLLQSLDSVEVHDGLITLTPSTGN
jgi:hypothetical protein